MLPIVPVADQPQLGDLHVAVGVEILPEPEPAQVRSILHRKEDDVPRIGTRGIRRGPATGRFPPIHAEGRHAEAAGYPVLQRADQELGRHRGSLELPVGAAQIVVQVVAGGVDAVILEESRVGLEGIVGPGERHGAVERGAAYARRRVGRDARTGVVVVMLALYNLSYYYRRHYRYPQLP